MLAEQVLFLLAAAVAVAGALGVVMLQNPFFSVLALVVHLVALSIIFLLLSAAFIAAAQVVVYAGAVMVLYVFVAAYVGGSDEPLSPEGGALRVLGPLFALAIMIEITIAVVGSGLGALGSRGPDVAAGFGSPEQIGSLLLQRFLVPFEGASFLLLVSAVGAVVLARKRRGLETPDLDTPGGAASTELARGSAG